MEVLMVEQKVDCWVERMAMQSALLKALITAAMMDGCWDSSSGCIEAESKVVEMAAVMGQR